MFMNELYKQTPPLNDLDISSYFFTMLVHNLKKSLTTKPSPFKYGRKPAFIQIILHISQIKRLLRFDSIGCWWMKSTSENVRLTWLVRLMVLLSEDVYYFTWLKTQYADHFYIHFPHPIHCLSLAEDCLVHLLTKTGKVVLHPSTVFKKLFSNDFKMNKCNLLPTSKASILWQKGHLLTIQYIENKMYPCSNVFLSRLMNSISRLELAYRIFQH